MNRTLLDKNFKGVFFIYLKEKINIKNIEL